MTIKIPAGSTLALKAVYLDKLGNPTVAPDGAGQISWSDPDATVATLDATVGTGVNATATGGLNATMNLTVTDGSMTSAPEPVVVVAGPAESLVIQAA